MSNLSFLPIQVVPAVPKNDGGIRFLHSSGQIDITPSLAKSVWKILEYSNGYRDVATIAELSKMEEKFVNEVLSDLILLGIVVDSRKQFIHFHKISNYPPSYSRSLTHEEVDSYTDSPRKQVKQGDLVSFDKDTTSMLSKVLFNRRSCRSFSEEKLTLTEIGNLCYHGYSISRHATPSGGALYPLKVYVLISEDQDGLRIGYYEYDCENDVLIRFKEEVDKEMLKHCFNSEILPFNSSVQIIIAADLDRQPFKYSNRGYRLTLIEAGHVAQNICLYAEENNIGACELGGVLDETLIQELDLRDEEVYPLLAIVLGKKSQKEIFDYFEYAEKIQTEFVGNDKPIKSFGTHAFGSDSSFVGAYANYGNENEYAGATSNSFPHAMSKAIIEAYERYRSSQARVDICCPANDLDSWLDPREIRSLTVCQSQSRRLSVFSENLPIHWTLGKQNKKNIFVPTDLVYYGHQVERNRICFGDSSGVSAYSDLDTAVRLGMLELIERDAIMRNWYERKSPTKLSGTILSLHVKKRINYWKKQGREVFVLDMNSPYAPTIQVVIIGNSYPCFVSGASATLGDIDRATLKALREAEYNLYLSLKFPKKERILLENVISPADHGLVYAFPEHLYNIKWLWQGDFTDKQPSQTFSFIELETFLDPILVDMSTDDSSIKVVRVLSKKCLPISFGFGMDYYTHPIMDTVVSHPDSRKLPHYFA